MRVLGIETSCDETGIAIFDDQKGILSHQLYSQVKLHADYGGVVPELASRDHVRKTIPLIQAALQEAGLGKDDIDGIAYTAGPGLVGAILVGATIGRSLAMAWGKPAVAVHHMEGHLLAPMLEERAPEFPFVALLVSGGHSMLVRVDGIGSYQLLGESIDDAAGEAFDKTAKLMGLDYPGGPLLSRLAEKGTTGRFTFPRPMTDRPGLDMSFSGLKTAVLNEVNQAQMKGADINVPDLAASFQERIAGILAEKLLLAAADTGAKQVCLAGGVAANGRLRQLVNDGAQKLGAKVYLPELKFCGDNGAMIAAQGYYQYMAGHTAGLDLNGLPTLPIDYE